MNAALIVLLLALVMPITSQAQADCLESRLEPYRAAQVSVPTLDMYENSYSNTVIGQLSEGAVIRLYSGYCAGDGVYWWDITYNDRRAAVYESRDGVYALEPAEIIPTPTAVFNLPPLATPLPPVISDRLPSVIPLPNPGEPVSTFVDWAHPVELPENFYTDPAYNIEAMFAVNPPDVYAGDMPALPVALAEVRFVTDADLNASQYALLAQNGFVVVPAGREQMDDVYGLIAADWYPIDGYGQFITTDTMLHSLYLAFDNLLSLLEQDTLYDALAIFIADAYTAAEDQARAAAGTPLQAQARSATIYYGVALQLLVPSPEEAIDEADLRLLTAQAEANPTILAEAEQIAQVARAAAGTAAIPFLDNYIEDFSGYAPRGHYSGLPRLERYFRALTWLGRITFRAASERETQVGLLALRALESSPDALAGWNTLNDTITFMVGETDGADLRAYSQLTAQIYPDNTLTAFADTDALAAFQAAAGELPAPRINTLFLPPNTAAEDLDSTGRGLRLMGQRFTLDANALQQLMSPYVPGRSLPSALDVAAMLGSDSAYRLALENGAGDLPEYEAAMFRLREGINRLTVEDWLRDIYRGWLWALQPLWARHAGSYPPLMNTEAWRRRDLYTGLASYTQLKHATVLYAAPPAGLGGGGGELPITYGYVEPNPLVFARTAIVSEMLFRGLLERDLILDRSEPNAGALIATHEQFRRIAELSSRLALMAQKELNGEPLTEQEYYYIQYSFGRDLTYIRLHIQQFQEGPARPVAVVTDIASSPTDGTVLQEGVGAVDLIYVVIPTPDGLQLARGANFSYYEFTGDSAARLTDDEWRARVAAGDVPPRPQWIDLFFAE